MSKMGEYQQILLDMLKEITSLCDRMRIPYYLAEGTCLGAIRHNGFIPWDDDVDIVIPDNYAEFLYSCQKYLSPRYKIMGGLFKDENLRIIDTSVRIKRPDNIVDKKDKLTHPWIDIIMLYGLPDNRILKRIHYFRLFFYQKLFKLSDREHIYKRKRGKFAALVVYFSGLIHTEKLINGYSQLKRLKNIGAKYLFENSNYVVAFHTWYGVKEIMPKEVYGDGVMVPFETIKARVPQKFDEYLTQLYGDYKQLPPESERVGKHQITIVE